MITVSIGLLEKQKVHLEGQEPKELLEIPDSDVLSVTSPVKYTLDCELISGGVRVIGKVTTSVSGICGRCLVPVSRSVRKDDLDLFFELPESGDELDLTEDIRAELLLEFPMLLLCSEDCKGLCPVCGKNLNTDRCSCLDDGRKKGPSPWDTLDHLKLE